MAIQDKNTFEGTFNNPSTGLFKDNTSKDIEATDSRTLVTNIKDSFFNKIDDAYTGAKGQRAGVTAPASLKDIVTTALSFGTMITFTDSTASNVVRIYELTNETTAESSPTIIRPNDYTATTNEKVWRLRSTTDIDSDTGGGGGGAVDSVNGATGVVVLDAGDIGYTAGGGISSTNVQSAIAELDTDVDNRISAAISGLKWKNPARVATTANGTLATAYENGDTVDGVVLATGDRIVLKNQTTQTENGIYTVNASGAPTRATDSDTAVELEGATLGILEGSTNANTTWVQTTDNITLGVSNIVWTQFGSSTTDADATTKGIARLYPSTSLGTNTDGAPTQNAVKVYTDAKVVDAINNGATTTAPSENAVFDGLALKLNRNLEVKTKTASHTLDSGDLTDLNAGKDILFLMNVASGHNFTIPPNATIDVDAGGHIYVMRIGLGQTTFVAGAGVTITGSSGNLLDPKVDVLMPLIQTADNTWYLQNGSGGSYLTWSPGFTGFSANPSSVDATYVVLGKFAHIRFNATPGTSNTTTFTITGLPVAPRVGMNFISLLMNNGGTVTGRVDIAAGTTTITMYATAGAGAWTASGNKNAYLNFMMEVQ